MKKTIPALLLPVLLSAHGAEPGAYAPDYNVWLTGPIVAPSGHSVAAPHVNYEPYFYYTQNCYTYDKHWNTHRIPTFTTFQVQPTFQIGVNSFMEFDIIAPQFSYNNTVKEHDWVLNDVPFGLGIQLVQDKPGKTWYPAVKLKLNATLPIGKYERFSSEKKGTDNGGGGNWNPSAGLVFSRLFWLTGKHYLAARYFFQYAVPLPVNVRGINAYGGARHTRGTVYPGNVFFTDLGLEYTVSQNWAFAFDLAYQHNNKQRFSGRSGGAAMRTPSREQISIAPAIEYNWNANVGAIFGPWFTIAGRNSTQFMSWILAINAYV